MDIKALFPKLLVRSALVGSSFIQRHPFWLQAALGRNQLFMHECDNGEISVGKVSEQLYSEGFIPAYHRVLTRELGPDRAREALREVGTAGATWEIQEAIEHGIWVPSFLKPWIGNPELLNTVRSSWLLHALLRETMYMVFHMIMTEGGWGVIHEINIAAEPMFIRVTNTPESRQLAPSKEPTCHIMSGIYRAYIQEIFTVRCDVSEVSCRSTGDPFCIFEFSNVRPKANQ